MAPKRHGRNRVGQRKAVVAKRKTHPGLPDQKNLELVDVFLFLADARIPWTSVELAGPYLTKKRRVYILAKSDLADPELTREWLSVFEQRGDLAFAVDCKRGTGIEDLLVRLRSEKARLDAKRPRVLLHRPLRLMLFGPPNVGKSSLANRLLGTTKAPFGAKPGLTRSSNWLKGRGFLEILDTPGVVDTSLVKGEAQLKLAAAWSLPENRYDPEEVAYWLAEKTSPEGSDPARQLEDYGRSRGLLQQGGIVDLERACKAFIRDFREGTLGRFTLETPSEFPDINTNT
jgi:ribosome biogenesis GTPase A